MSKNIWLKIISLTVLLVFVVSACGTAATPTPEVITQQIVVTATPAATQNPYDEKAPIKVWVDTERARYVDRFIQAYPEYKDLIQVVTDDRGTFIQKLLLYNNVGSGWPDVTFKESPDVRLSATIQYDEFPMDLRDWVPADVLSKFAPGSMEPCTLPDGTVICLRNDIAPYVLYINVPKMQEWGYTVPTTWEEFATLAEKVSKDHPGTIMADMSNYLPEQQWFANSQCPMMTPADATTYLVNLNDPKCTRVATFLDQMDKLGVMWKLAPWDAAIYTMFAEDNWLMYTGPIWSAAFLFPGYLGDAGNGKVGVAPMPKWADQDQIYSGSGGGGAYVMSRHTQNPMLAAKLILFMATDLETSKIKPTLPAYQPNQQDWITAQFATLPLWAPGTDATGTAQTMAGTIWNGIMDGPPNSDNVIVPFWNDVSAGTKTVTGIMPDLQKALETEVTKSGYNVITTAP